MYLLVGYTLYKEGASHFTAAVMWGNKWWFYDGLSETDQTRMTPMKEAYMSGHKGSYVLLKNDVLVVSAKNKIAVVTAK